MIYAGKQAGNEMGPKIVEQNVQNIDQVGPYFIVGNTLKGYTPSDLSLSTVTPAGIVAGSNLDQ